MKHCNICRDEYSSLLSILNEPSAARQMRVWVEIIRQKPDVMAQSRKADGSCRKASLIAFYQWDVNFSDLNCHHYTTSWVVEVLK